MHVPVIRLPQVRVLAGIGAGVLIGVIGVGVVTAAPGTQTNALSAGSATAATPVQLAASTGASGATGTTGTKPNAKSNAIRPGAFRALIRNDYRVTINATNTAGSRNILYVRGDIAIGSGTVTVTLPDNSTQVFTTDSSTVVREQGKTITLADLSAGERAMVFGTRNSDGTYTAKLIRCVKEAPATTTPGATAAPTT
jgi:hypothetical protein